ncbi:MAG TPA: hypothetical protein VMA37_06610 [Acetobacteraceae bacterium]|nr:hypothetical protein [Acetobacteraceae bacterium]
MAEKNLGPSIIIALGFGAALVAGIILSDGGDNTTPSASPSPLLGKRVQISAATYGCPDETMLNVAQDWELAHGHWPVRESYFMRQGCVWVYAQGEGTVEARDGQAVQVTALVDWQGKPFAESQDGTFPDTLATTLWIWTEPGDLLTYDWKGKPLD